MSDRLTSLPKRIEAECYIQVYDIIYPSIYEAYNTAHERYHIDATEFCFIINDILSEHRMNIGEK